MHFSAEERIAKGPTAVDKFRFAGLAAQARLANAAEPYEQSQYCNVVYKGL